MGYDQLSVAAAHWVTASYWLMFVAMLVEGPVVTAAGAFAAALGYFNVWIVFVLSVFGNLIPDVIYYLIGFWGREGVIDKYGKYLKITKEKVGKLENLYHKHIGKTLTAVKLIPVLATPGLIVAGIARLPLKKYICWSVIVTIPSSLFYLVVGYYFGAAYAKITRYFEYGEYTIVGIIALLGIIYYASIRLSKKLGEKMEA